MKSILVFIIFAFSVGIIVGQENRKTKNEIIKTQTKTCQKCGFHWVEVENTLYTVKVRHIEVFLKDQIFSEENLKRLFAHISKNNPEPKHLTIVVRTSWAFWCFSNCPSVMISEQPDRPDEYDYLQATYYRRENREYFSYSPAVKVHAANFKTVIIKEKQISLKK